MQTISLNEQELFKALAEEQLIITPNQHLAYVLLNAFFRQHSAKKIQTRPTCLPYETFLTTCYAELIKQHAFSTHPILLDTNQARLLWLKTCQANGDSFPISLLDKAYTAWQLCQTWEISLHSTAFNLTSQTQLFHHWACAYNHALSKLGAITESQIVSYLLNFELVSLYKTIIFACFDDFNPQQVKLQHYMKARQVSVGYYDVHSKDKHNHTYCFTACDEENEREVILNWLRQQPKDKPCALIVPNLEQLAPLLKRWLQAHFPNTPLYFSLGHPLSDYPLVNQALICLSLSKTTLSRQQLNILLQSSFMSGYPEEQTERYALLMKLPEVESYSFANALAFLKPTCPLLAKTLENLTAYPAQTSSPNWANYFIIRLKESGFTQVALNSETYQTYQRFMNLLESFRNLILIYPSLSAQKALQTLTYLTEHTLFQAEQPYDAPIHVLGPFEAAGVPYQAAWFMSLTDEQLPGTSLPNPFIPVALQQSHHLPHTDIKHDLILAKRRLCRFQASQGQLILSYPQKTQDVINRPSLLLSEFPALVSSAFSNNGPSPLNASLSTVYPTHEWIEEPLYIPVKQNEPLSQGTSILSEQAKCPFRAFATHRLRGSATDKNADLLSNKTRGMLLHRCLESLWRQIPSQSALLVLGEEELNTKVVTAVRQTLSEFTAVVFNLAPPIQKLEEERLIRLLYSSFNWETTRQPFKVDQLEKTYILTLGPLTFRMRVDRIDVVNGNEKWVTDYKTTCPTPLPWQSAVPVEPQILLYALIDPAIRGLIFHELKKGHSTIKGISALPHSQLSHHKTVPWEELRETWRHNLILLAEDFYAGYCAAKPSDERLCRDCEYQNLCRVDF